MVAESTGAWETDASHILLLLSRGAAAREGSDPGALHACLLLVPELDAFKVCHRPVCFLPYFLSAFLSRASFDLLIPFSGLRTGMNLLPSGCHGPWVVPATTQIDSQIFRLALEQCHTLGGVCPFSLSSPSSSNFTWTERAM